MKKILIHATSLPRNWLYDTEIRDAYFDPHIYLRERLWKLGYSLENFDNQPLEGYEWVFFFEAENIQSTFKKRFIKYLKAKIKDRPVPRDLYGECIQVGMDQRIALFLWESPAVSRENWDPELHKLFPLIFTWHDNYVNGNKFIKIHWPQTRQFPSVPKIAFRDRKLLVNISTNKFSRHPRELYSARRVSIRHFERNHPDDFALYGLGWDWQASILEKILPITRQIYTSYRGIIKNKWDVLPRYRFSLCYENIHNEPGYLTEKIFDCMRAKCVPIYWGAPNITDYVDADAFIDRRQFRSDIELESYLLSMTEQEYERFQAAMQDYLQSERFAKFLPPAYADILIHTLNL